MTSDQQEPSPAPAEVHSTAPANQTEASADISSQTSSQAAAESSAEAPSKDNSPNKPATDQPLRQAPGEQAASESPTAAAASSEQTQRAGAASRPRIKIGTQRQGVAVPRIPPRVATVFRTPGISAAPSAAKPPQAPGGAAVTAVETQPEHRRHEAQPPDPAAAGTQSAETTATESQSDLAPKPVELTPGKSVKRPERPARPTEKVAVPSLRAELPPELAEELEASLGGMSIDELIESEPKSATSAEQLEADAKVRGTVLHIHRDSVFVDLGGPNQGVFPSRQFVEPPQIGAIVEGIVVRFNAEEGLFELTVSGGAVDVGDWSQVAEGMVVEGRITGHNKGGLECDVNKLRGFIPMSQIAPYRVEQPEQFVGQTLVCLVTEVDPERRKLVLSRRSMIEREQAAAKEKMLAELAPGQIREGIVRSLREFGAFVDIGGVDGLLHVSQISWDRIKHPNEVLKEGQKIRVKIDKINPETHKISLSYRDLSENPWKNAASKYAVTSVVKGTVSKLTEFGAFVRLEAGIEGLIHISELAHQRVFRASDVVSEGQEVDVKVLSVDPDAQRISLSLKALQARPEPKKKAAPEPEEEAPPPPKSKRSVPLKGGLGRSPGGVSGLKW